VSLELTDLHGDVMATVNPAADAAPSATYSYSEFGATETGSATPGEYGYLGGSERSDSAIGGTILMGVRGYSVNDGRFDETDAVSGSSANSYDYCNQNPIICTDLGGRFPGWAKSVILSALTWVVKPFIAGAIAGLFPAAAAFAPEIANCVVGLSKVQEMKQKWTFSQRLRLARSTFRESWRNDVVGAVMVLLAALVAVALHLSGWETVLLIVVAGALGSGPIGRAVLRRFDRRER
jgi:RHS repeat-associated protein